MNLDLALGAVARAVPDHLRVTAVCVSVALLGVAAAFLLALLWPAPTLPPVRDLGDDRVTALPQPAGGYRGRHRDPLEDTGEWVPAHRTPVYAGDHRPSPVYGRALRLADEDTVAITRAEFRSLFDDLTAGGVR
jgi:hypothetical protein